MACREERLLSSAERQMSHDSPRTTQEDAHQSIGDTVVMEVRNPKDSFSRFEHMTGHHFEL